MKSQSYLNFLVLMGIVVLLLTVSSSAIAHDKVVVVPLSSSIGKTTGGVQIVTSATGRIWMDRNLGALRAAINMVDLWAYGGLFQWGRANDGHAYRASTTTTNLSSFDDPGSDSFILANNSVDDWRVPQNRNLWQGVSGINNPCPAGFRLPTAEEWREEVASWSSQDAAGGFASPLKLVLAGMRYLNTGFIDYIGLYGFYWSSSAYTQFSSYLSIVDDSTYVISNFRANGYSVRCIKD